MKEIIYYIIPVIIVFCLIGIMESAIVFEKEQEEISFVPSEKIITKNREER